MTDTMASIENRMAAAMWKQEALGSSPRSVYEGRTYEAWMDQAPELREKWLKLARAAFLSLPVGDSRDRLITRLSGGLQNAIDHHGAALAVVRGNFGDEYAQMAEEMRIACERWREILSTASPAPVVKPLVEALAEIRDRHVPDQPMSDGADEADYVRRQYLELRRIARTAIVAYEGEAP